MSISSRLAFTVQQFAKLFGGVSVEWVNAQIDAGEIDYFTIGNRRFIPMQWVLENTSNPKILRKVLERSNRPSTARAKKPKGLR